jgi:hypothetical protein
LAQAGKDPRPALPDPIFDDAYLRWCRTAADAVLLLAY